MKKKHLHLLSLSCCLLLVGAPTDSVFSQDTVKAHTLQSVGVSASRPSEVTAQTPVQVLTSEQLTQTGASTLSDAVKQMNGVSLKDYGGVGGIKTVSARGLGSQFSTLSIDGIAVTDCQNGQPDLGRYLLGNSDHISLTHGQQGTSLQSARCYAAGNVINMETQRPKFTDLADGHTATVNSRISVEGGSFGFLSPTLSWEQRVSHRLSYSLWANHMQSDGDYPYTIYYTANQTDSSSREIRQHSQVNMTTADGNLFWDIAPKQSLTAKIHYTQSHHNLPGPVIFYNTQGSESTDNRAFFVQAKYRNIFTDKLQLQAIGKYSRNFDTYDDTAVNNSSRLIHNEYRQQEGYISATLAYEPIDHLVISLATDEAASHLESNLAQNNSVTRLITQDVLAISYRRQRFDVAANILATLSDENSNDGIVHQYKRLSPYIGGTIQLWPFPTSHTQQVCSRTFLRLRYFFKETYRLPNFNEIYYFTMTRDLNPERALQHNLGLTLSHTDPRHNGSFQITLDGYHNRVNDKIIAVPTQNLFLWSMSNLGQVNIYGLDANIEYSWHNTDRNLSITIAGNYTFQSALDVTDPDSKTYRNQIPYTPRHAGGATVTIESPWANIGYSAVFVGDRYRLGQNTPSSLVKGYMDHGVTLSRKFDLRRGWIRIQGQLLNIFDAQYEVIKSYPMMGRNWRIGITYSR